MLHSVGNKKFDGVTGMWYGKAPGVDRSGDALKHANYTGIDKNGGVLAIVGDDPSCKSSSLCSQSEPMLFHVGMPSLYPGNVQEILDLGLHGYLMSRLSGLWVGLKIVTNVADGTGSANVSPERLTFVTPDLTFDGKPFTPNMNLGMNVRAEALEMERSLYTRRLEVAKRYARENKLNNVVFPNPDAWLGIITAGKTYHDLRQSFLELGLDDAALRRYGIRILKMGMLFPMEPTIVRDFARGLEEIFVIEEKRPFLEMFAKNVMYGQANAPRIVGKFDEEENELLPHYGEFESDVIGRALTKRLSRKAAGRIGRGMARASGRDPRAQQAGHGDAHRVVLLGLSAQQLDPGGRGQLGLGRHRLPHDGDVDGAQRRDGHSHGRRRRAVDRHGAVHRHQAHFPEHGRRHLCPFGQPRDPLRRRDQHQHHLQVAASTCTPR